MKEIFYGCDNLAYIDISNFNMSKCENYNNMFSSTNKIKFINLFNLANDKTISKVFRKTKNLIFICQSEEIIKNPKAYNCCDYNIELDECDMPSFIIPTIEESTFISPQSTVNTEEIFSNISTDYELTTTYFSERIDTTFNKESTELLAQTSQNLVNTDAFANIGSTINKEPSTFITEETEHFNNSNIKEDTESTTIYGIIDTTDKTLISNSEISNSTEIKIPSTIPFDESDSSLNKKSTIINSATDSIKSSNNFTDIEQMTTDFSENTKGNIDTTFIKQSTESIIKTSEENSILKTENMEHLDSTILENQAESANNNDIETTYVPNTTNLLVNTSLIEESALTTSKSETQSESKNAFSSNVNEVDSTDMITSNEITSMKSTNMLKETDLKTTSLTDNISTNFSPEEPKEIPTTELESTAKEEITEKTTSEIEKEEIATSNLEIFQNTHSNIDTTRSTIPKVDTTHLEQSTINENIPEHTTFKVDINETTTSINDILETTNSKLDTKEINTFNKLTTSEPEILEPTTSEPKKPEPTTSKPEILEPTTSEPKKPEPTTSKPEILEPTTAEPKKLEPTTSKTEILEPTTDEPKMLEPTTSKPEIIEPTTSEPKKPEPTTTKPEILEPTTSEPKKPEPTTSKPEILEPTTSEPKKPEPTTSKPEKIEPTSQEVKASEMGTTSNINQKTEAIPTTIPNNLNLTSIISPTTITDYGSAYAVLVGFSSFLKYISYCTFYVHFRSIKGYIFSPSLLMKVRLINNRLLRNLQSQQAKCEKVNDDLENAAYLCNVTAVISNVSSLKIEDDYNFESQDIKVIGISPVAYSLMENIQKTEGKYDTLLQSNIYVLDHSIINTNNKTKTFNITGMIEDEKPAFENIDLLLKINVQNLEDIKEADINCIIAKIKDSNYTLNCQGEEDILYNLQSAVSFINDSDLLLVNFDENTTSEIIFYTSSSNHRFFLKSKSNNLSAGAIVAIALGIIVAAGCVIAFIILSKKIKGKTEEEITLDSTVVKINANN